MVSGWKTIRTMNLYRDNKIDQVRPGSTFESFEVYDPELGQSVELLKDIADQVIAARERILKEEFPFDNGKVLFLWSEPGRGKTHLVEAFVNRVLKGDKRLAQRMVLSRGCFYYDFQIGENPYHGAPIVIIDDMFHDMQSVAQLHPATEIAAFMKFMTMVYERRVLALVTSNFPLMDGILARVKEVDKVGRILSRAKEVLSYSGEIHLAGKDFREELAERRKGQGFKL